MINGRYKAFFSLVLSAVLLAFLFTTQYAEAGLKKAAAAASMKYAAKKMLQPGLSGKIKARAAKKLWETLDNNPSLASKAVGHLRAEAIKNPSLAREYSALASRVEARYPALTSIHSSPMVGKINGRLPINHEYAGKIFPASKLPVQIREKYPDGVPFTARGFPDFGRYAIKKVRITPQGNRNLDFKEANKAAGYSRGSPKPQEHTWHHTENTGELILIPSDIHKAVLHTGGIAVGR